MRNHKRSLPKITYSLVLLFLVIIVNIAGLRTLLAFETTDTPSKNQHDAILITITNEGFHPREITIASGQKVIWKNSDTTQHWPASDPHPKHSIYAGFDAATPLEKEDTWEFIFENPGEWTYHDHLFPIFQGKIIVKGGSEDTKPVTRESCKTLTAESAQIQCWDKLIAQELKTDGMEKAFGVFAQLYATEPVFVSQGCHWAAHGLGEEAYRLYSQGKNIALTEQTSYCGYGFYHGFMQLLLNNDGDVEKAKVFCEKADRQLREKAPLTRINCFHGIGHGLVDDPLPIASWGKPQVTVDKLAPICADISDNPHEQKECTDGIFNAIVLFMEADQYDLTLNRKDPLGWCAKQKTDLARNSCYYESAQKLDSISNWNVQNVVQLVRNLDDNTAKTVMAVATAAMMQRDISRQDNNPYVIECRKVPDQLRDHCLGGIVGGFVSHGEPEKEYVKLLEFCRSPVMNEREKTYCYNIATHRFIQVYDAKKAESICGTIEEKYKAHCPAT